MDKENYFNYLLYMYFVKRFDNNVYNSKEVD